MVAERLTRHHTPVTMVDELWQRVEAAWVSVPEHAILTQCPGASRFFCDLGSLVVTVTNSSLVPLKTRRIEGLMLDKSVKGESPPIGGAWKFRERSESSGVILITRQWFKIKRPVANSPHVALWCDFN
ncbi:hypothetical protein TNCV_2604361 [Trichonephila clavipes]|nr:hypothetical protein TNCV_2604361 [Trichonephila clavipes]